MRARWVRCFARTSLGTSRERLVAVKVFRLDLTPEQAWRARRRAERARRSRDRSSEHCSADCGGLEYGTAYLAQEYAVGDSLDVVLRERGAMSIDDVVELVRRWRAPSILRPTARGVHHGSLHLRDIVLVAGRARVRDHRIRHCRTRLRRLARSCRRVRSIRRPTVRPTSTRSAPSRSRRSPESARLPSNLADFEQAHGVELRGAFDAGACAQLDAGCGRSAPRDFAAVAARMAAELTSAS